MARVAGFSETTVRAGVFDLEAGGEPLSGRRVRRPSRDRKRIEDTDSGVVEALLALVEPDQPGDPMSPSTVRRLLRAASFSLQANSKTLEGKQPPDRDAQFRYLNDQVVEHQKAGKPVISMDAKKKESLASSRTPAVNGDRKAILSRWRITVSSPARRVKPRSPTASTT